MEHSDFPSRFLCTGNDHVYVNGDGNACKISHSKQCFLLADQSDVIISNSSSIHANCSESSFNLANGTNARMTGGRNVIQGCVFDDFLFDGSSNMLAVNNVENLVWSGYQGQCNLVSGQDVKIYGTQNQIVGQSNLNLFMCGNRNTLFAAENENLKVRGNGNQVIATRTKNVTVDGDANRVAASDIKVRHSFEKVTSGLDTGFSFEVVPENKIEFCGVPIDCSVYTKVLIPPVHQRYVISMKPDLGTCVDERMFSANKNPSTVSTSIMPQIQISYVDQTHLHESSYKIGIFHVIVTNLTVVLTPHSPITVKIMVDELDRRSYNKSLGSSGKSAVFHGSKGGKRETLKLTGNRIVEKDNNSFHVYLATIERENNVIDASNSNDGDSDMDFDDFDQVAEYIS